ncbi:MAG TPA: lysophospholipid acyltransferase family protein [Pyrinomonadaceae bacterium]
MHASIEDSRPFNDSRTQRTLERAYEFSDLSTYDWKQRFLIRTADLAFFVLIKLIGATARWQIHGWENWESASGGSQQPIYTFWHNRVFLATHFWQRRRIVVMTSRSFDGEYIARFIKRFGYGATRGSSTRGGPGAIVEMVRLVRAGCPTAFTIDGPKGPVYVAKMGAVLLAKKTGQPILPFTITPRKYWAAKSWDRFQVPFPFTTARVEIAPPIYVSVDATDEVLSVKRDELQNALDGLNERGEEWRRGSSS